MTHFITEFFIPNSFFNITKIFCKMNFCYIGQFYAKLFLKYSNITYSIVLYKLMISSRFNILCISYFLLFF